MVLAVSYKRTEYAWRLYRIVSYEKIPQKDFRQQIVRCSSPSILPNLEQDMATRLQMRFGLMLMALLCLSSHKKICCLRKEL